MFGGPPFQLGETDRMLGKLVELAAASSAALRDAAMAASPDMSTALMAMAV